jgi:hypothetical protein
MFRCLRIGRKCLESGDGFGPLLELSGWGKDEFLD